MKQRLKTLMKGIIRANAVEVRYCTLVLPFNIPKRSPLTPERVIPQQRAFLAELAKLLGKASTAVLSLRVSSPLFSVKSKIDVRSPFFHHLHSEVT